jgi:hypothetical protein
MTGERGQGEVVVAVVLLVLLLCALVAMVCLGGAVGFVARDVQREAESICQWRGGVRGIWIRGVNRFEVVCEDGYRVEWGR